MTVPGVNVIVAATFLAAIGDIRRFPSAAKLVGYLGLDPRVRQSGDGPAKHGRISKQGSAPGPPRARRGRLERRRAARARCARSTSASARAAAIRSRSSPPPASSPCLFWCLLTRERGLRLRAAVADQEEAAPPRADRRRAEGPRKDRRPGRPTTPCATPNARSPHRPSWPTSATSPTGKPPGRQGGRERDTGARISTALEGQSRAADHSPRHLRFARQSPAPDATIPRSPKTATHHLTFSVRESSRSGGGVRRGR